MAYYSGTASSLADLRTALLTHAQTDGWTLTGDVLSKAGVYFRIQVTATLITCLGCESNAVANPAPNVVSIGRLYERSGQPTREISFPCSYEVFGFAQELYLVVNYDVEKYQWLAFGKSTVPGLTNPGGWCSAILGSTPSTYASVTAMAPITFYLSGINNLDAGIHSTSTPGMPFMSYYPLTTGDNDAVGNSFVNSGLDGHGWLPAASGQNGALNAIAAAPLLWLQPSTWNGECAFAPIRAYKVRPAYKTSLILEMQHARHLRMDNLTPGDVLTLGSEKWKCFPWHVKNTVTRNGGGSNMAYDHTGTLGWAIRYEGP